MNSQAIALYKQRRSQYALGRNLPIGQDQATDLIKQAMREAPSGKLDSFAAGDGTVLFFNDVDVTRGLQDQFPLYADNFPVWAEHANGIAQFAVWTALAEAGVGASLQHYNPLVDEAVRREWGIAGNWQLRAQMPFGSNAAAIGEKSYMEDEARFKVFA